MKKRNDIKWNKNKSRKNVKQIQRTEEINLIVKQIQKLTDNKNKMEIKVNQMRSKNKKKNRIGKGE